MPKPQKYNFIYNMTIGQEIMLFIDTLEMTKIRTSLQNAKRRMGAKPKYTTTKINDSYLIKRIS